MEELYRIIQFASESTRNCIVVVIVIIAIGVSISIALSTIGPFVSNRSTNYITDTNSKKSFKEDDK